MVKGLLVGTAGVGKAFVHGRVYHLRNLADFAGRYLAVEAEMAVMEGEGGAAMRNQHGVVMHLISVEQGVEVTLGTEVVEIKLRNE
jgi:sigma54-dependent transcription regulator